MKHLKHHRVANPIVGFFKETGIESANWDQQQIVVSKLGHVALFCQNTILIQPTKNGNILEQSWKGSMTD